MRTLIISDMHLGARLGHDVLSRPVPLQRLLDAVEGVDRLVLLGDVVSLMQGRPQQSMAAAEPILRAVGERTPARAEIVLVPGNHDLPLIRPWVRRNLRTLSTEATVPTGVTPMLTRLAGWLGPERVQVRYPGVWLAPRLWATHGHYLDRYLIPHSAFGASRRLLGGLPRGGSSPRDYERGGRSQVFGRDLVPRPLAELASRLGEALRGAVLPRLRSGLLHPRLSPLTVALLGAQVRLAALPALARVGERLGVEADWIVFGHVHRLGPLPGESLAPWGGRDGRPQLINSGSWLYDPLLIGEASPPHPYWPGGAVLLDGDAQPRPVGLLDDLDVSELC